MYETNNGTNATTTSNSTVGLGNGARRYDEMYNITLTFVGFLVVFACCVVLLLALLRAEQRLAATAEGKLPVYPARTELIQQASIVWEWFGHNNPGARTIKIGSDDDDNREDSSSDQAAEEEANDESSSSSTTIMDIILSASERAGIDERYRAIGNEGSMRRSLG